MNVYAGTSPAKNTLYHGVDGLARCGYQSAVVDLRLYHLPPTHPTISLLLLLVPHQRKTHFTMATILFPFPLVSHQRVKNDRSLGQVNDQLFSPKNESDPGFCGYS
jgi:hypothetical protein